MVLDNGVITEFDRFVYVDCYWLILNWSNGTRYIGLSLCWKTEVQNSLGFVRLQARANLRRSCRWLKTSSEFQAWNQGAWTASDSAAVYTTVPWPSCMSLQFTPKSLNIIKKYLPLNHIKQWRWPFSHHPCRTSLARRHLYVLFVSCLFPVK